MAVKPTFDKFKLALAIIVLALCSGVLPAQAKITLGSIFKDHMIIQRNEPIRIYGYGEPNEVVGVSLAGQKAAATTNSKGKWSVEFKPVSGGGPLELVVVSDTKIVVKDILVGEVWLCAGQSNMYLDIKSCHLTEKFKDSNFDGNIRFVNIPFKLATEPVRHTDIKWEIMNKENFERASTVAFQFANRIYKETGVPIGIVVAAVPGSKAQAWISKESISQYPFGRNGLKQLENMEGKPEGLYIFDTPTRLLSQKEIDESAKSEKLKRQLVHQKLFFAPTVAYNYQINPLVPFQFKGVLWYQGESNVKEPGDYSRYLSALVKDWRQLWSKPQMPFIYVQLPPFGSKQTKPDTKDSILAMFRSAQAECSVLPYAYMVVTLDCCPTSIADWHSSDKLKIGDRMADVALATQYNKPYPFKSPNLFTYDVKDRSVIIHFRNAKKLVVNGETVKGFVIAGRDKKPVFANAEVLGDSVKVWSEKVKYPRQVAYAWADNPDANLLGDGNLPVAPFIIDIDE